VSLKLAALFYHLSQPTDLPPAAEYLTLACILILEGLKGNARLGCGDGEVEIRKYKAKRVSFLLIFRT